MSPNCGFPIMIGRSKPECLFDHHPVMKPTADKFTSQLVLEGFCLQRLSSENLRFSAASPFLQMKKEKGENLLSGITAKEVRDR